MKWDSTKLGELTYQWIKIKDKRHPIEAQGYVVGPGQDGFLNTWSEEWDVVDGSYVISRPDYQADTAANTGDPVDPEKERDDIQMWPVGEACSIHTGCTVHYDETENGPGAWKFTLPYGNGRTLWFCQIKQFVESQVLQETWGYGGTLGGCHPVVRASAKTNLQDCAEFLLGIPYGTEGLVYCSGAGKQKEIDLDCSALCCEARVLQGRSAGISGMNHGSTSLVNGITGVTEAIGIPPDVAPFPPTLHMVGRRREYQGGWPLVAPRALLSTEGLGDLWANPLGTQMTNLAVGEVYKFLGAGDKIGIHYRPGGHAHNETD